MHQSKFENYATTMLVREGARTTSLDHLYAALTRQFGPVVSGPGELRQRLGRNPDRFLILDPPGSSPGSAALPDIAREAHETALASAGVAARPQVTLVGPADPSAEPGAPYNPAAVFSDPMMPLVTRLDTSICALAGDAEDDPTLADALAEALRETRDLQRAFNQPDGP